MKFIDADYYGYRDEDDGVLVPLELEHEKESRCLLESYFLSAAALCDTLSSRSDFE